MKTKIISDKNIRKKNGKWILRKEVNKREIYRVLKSESKAAAVNEATTIIANTIAGNLAAVKATKAQRDRAATFGEIITRYRAADQTKGLKQGVEESINALCNFICTVYNVKIKVGGDRPCAPARKAVNLSGSQNKQKVRELKVSEMSSRLLNPEAIKTYRQIKLAEGVKYMAYEKVPEHEMNTPGQLNPAEDDRLRRTVHSVILKIRSLFATNGRVVGNLMSDDPDEGIYTDIKIPDEVHAFCRVKPRGINKVRKKKYRLPDLRSINRLKQGLLSIVKTDPEVYKAFKIAFCCGCRIGEIKFLMWDDIRMEGNGIWIYLGVNQSSTGTKSSKERKVEISPSLYDELVGMATHDEYVIGGDYQYRKRKLEKEVAGWMRKCGWTRHQCIHEMRKYFGSLLAEETQSLQDVAHVLGHASPQTTHDAYYDKIAKVEYRDFNNDLPSPEHNKSRKVRVSKVA